MKMVNTLYNPTEDSIDEIQNLKSKTNLNFYKNKSNYYDNMTIRFDEDYFVKNAQDISKNYHEVLKLMKFLQTRPQVKNMNINYYDLYYTAFENRKEKQNVDHKYENDFTNFNDFITPNYILSIKPRETFFK